MRSDGDHTALRMQLTSCLLRGGGVFPTSCVESWIGLSICLQERPYVSLDPRRKASKQDAFSSTSIIPVPCGAQQNAFTLVPSSSAIRISHISVISLHSLLYYSCPDAQRASGFLVKTLITWPTTLGCLV